MSSVWLAGSALCFEFLAGKLHHLSSGVCFYIVYYFPVCYIQPFFEIHFSGRQHNKFGFKWNTFTIIIDIWGFNLILFKCHIGSVFPFGLLNIYLYACLCDVCGDWCLACMCKSEDNFGCQSSDAVSIFIWGVDAHWLDLHHTARLAGL